MDDADGDLYVGGNGVDGLPALAAGEDRGAFVVIDRPRVGGRRPGPPHAVRSGRTGSSSPPPSLHPIRDGQLTIVANTR